jgi:AbrB family looped-hinge helix DNA binding protein
MTHKVGPKGQVVIPKDLRERLGLSPGDEVEFRLEDKGVLVEPARGGDRQLQGRFRDLPIPLTRLLEREHRNEIEGGR